MSPCAAMPPAGSGAAGFVVYGVAALAAAAAVAAKACMHASETTDAAAASDVGEPLQSRASHHITSYHIISHHITSYHIISYHASRSRLCRAPPLHPVLAAAPPRSLQRKPVRDSAASLTLGGFKMRRATGRRRCAGHGRRRCCAVECRRVMTTKSCRGRCEQSTHGWRRTRRATA
jgi:hypothetical protein